MNWTAICSAFLFMGAVLLTAQQSQQNGQQSNTGASAAEPGPGRAWEVSPRVVIPVTQTGKRNFDAANAERRKQIADDSAKLLKLATDLKAEVDKTSKDTLSLNVIRKADEIERLAHSVKEKMKLTVGTN
jgi:hypothetical protein